MRIVFDSAAKVKGVSLNDLLETGPNLLNDLTGILLRFRRYKFAVVDDISKKFLQILLNPEDQVFHGILWRKDPQYKPEVYQFKIVIFGDAPLPFLACHVIKRVLEDYSDSNVNVFNALIRNLYMDDLLHSCTSVAEAKDIVKGTCEVLEKGGFRIRNWICNDEEILREMTEEKKKDVKQLGEDWQKVLGLNWNPMTDTFTFRTSEDNVSWTKRTVVSHISKFFDPCGFLAPFLITGKIFMQDLWRRRLEWEDQLDEDLMEKWLAWHDQLQGLERLKIPRHINTEQTNGKKLELHVFSDASEKAMAAVAYLRKVMESGSAAKSYLLMAKTQVAPLRVMTVPRLELQSCLMAVKLMQFIEKHLDLPLVKILFWTDSTVALAWIKSESRTLKPFVANRVASIQESTEINQWHHVPGKENPADIASRGTNLCELEDCDNMWFSGHDLLKQSHDLWPQRVEYGDLEAVAVEQRKVTHAVEADVQNEVLDIESFSSWMKLRNVIGYVRRPFKRWKQRVCGGANIVQETVSVEERQEAEEWLIRQEQQKFYQRELQDLSSKKPLFKKSNIYDLNPFIYEKGLLRVGGRLIRTSLEYASRHQIILPKQSHLIQLIIREKHEEVKHFSVNYVLNAIRSKYWPGQGRAMVKRTLRSCVICKKLRGVPLEQIMADLPTSRVEACGSTFKFTGVDLFGPIITKARYRGGRREKRYGVLFTCLQTRAIHIELAYSQSTDDFMKAFKRFIARRSKPLQIFSDCGTNFVGAKRELQDIMNKWVKSQRLHNRLTDENIKWIFNPPAAPHMGDVWESLVKLAKRAMTAATRGAELTDEELMTVLTECKAMLNNRPLTYISNDPDDIEPLTPAHFLNNKTTTLILQHNLENQYASWKKRWLHCQNVVNRI